MSVLATLNQNNRPVAFYSKSLNRNELNQFSVEKEATARIKAGQNRCKKKSNYNNESSNFFTATPVYAIF